MIIIKAISTKLKDHLGNDLNCKTPEKPCPPLHKMRFIGGEFQAIPKGDEWKD